MSGWTRNPASTCDAVKLLHTSDWHLGATLGRHDRAEDQREALKDLFDIAKRFEPDLILHTGDLFDGSRPPYPALRMGVRALARLSDIAPTIVIRGNHDSISLFRILDEIFRGGGFRRLRFVTEPRVEKFPPAAGLASDPVALVCVPFISPGSIVDYASDEIERFEGSYADGIKALNSHLLDRAEKHAGSRGIILYAAHLHLHGARPGMSERRMHVGEDYATHTEGLDRAIYCAFGHIHDPQLLPGGIARGRYAGSLVPLDFGETSQTKHAVLVTMGDRTQVKEASLRTGRPLVRFEGSVEELDARAADGGLNGCILKATVQSDDPVPDLAERLLEGSPKCTVFNLVNQVSKSRAKEISESEDGEGGEPAVEELFAEWRSSAATGAKASDGSVVELFEQALAGVGEENAPDFGAARLGERAKGILEKLRQNRHRGERI